MKNPFGSPVGLASGKVTVLPRVSTREGGMMSALISVMNLSSTALGVPPVARATTPGDESEGSDVDTWEYEVPAALRLARLGHRCAAMHLVTSEACKPSTLIRSTWRAGEEPGSAPEIPAAPALAISTLRATTAERGGRCFMGPPLVRGRDAGRKRRGVGSDATPRSARPRRV